MTAILHRVKEMVLMFAKQNKTKKRKKKNNKTMPIFKRLSWKKKKNQSAVVRTGKGQTELSTSSKVNFSPKLGFNGC